MGEAAAKKEKKARLPAWAPWLIGWVGVLAASVLLVYFWRVVFFQQPLPDLPALPATLGVAGILSLLYLALFFICRLKADKLCLKAALVVFLLGLLFCFATAPLQAPDESRHYLRAYSISMGRFTYDVAESYPDDVNALVQSFGLSPPLNHQVSYNMHQLAPATIADYQQLARDGTAEAASSPIMFMLLPFLPQALFMAVGRLFGLSALGLMYAGRIANLLMYTLICYAAFRNCQKYRGVFFAFALLPLSLFMAASCSYDSLMLAACFLLLSFFCKAEIHTRDLVVFGLALAFCCYIKPNNIVLVALLLLIPKTRWKSRWNPWLVTGAAALAALAFWYFTGKLDSAVLATGWDWENMPRGSGEEAAPAAQFIYVLQYPLRFLVVALQSLVEANGFLFDLGRLGSMDLVLPLVGGLSVLCLAFASALGIQQKEDTKTGAAVGLGLAALLYTGAIMAGMYVTDSDYQSIRITGMQPRYFLPVFLLLFMLASILLGRAVRPRLSAQSTALRTQTVTLWVAAALALFAAVLLFQSYFIGQWLPKGEGGWKLVNLFGWVQT